ncbi:glycoside hydrolase domain-containing protein [Bifidobacterium fermentum]|uniref:Glycoside hydrolase family 92 protein n=1 Tax=Bifidobacterium fermentum TaxID=3059035 RepID=A0AB39UL19_9BIFI
MKHSRTGMLCVAMIATIGTFFAGMPASAMAADDTSSTQTTAQNALSQTADSLKDASSTSIQELVSTASSNHAGSGSESVSQVKDNDESTKWYEGEAAPTSASPVYVIYSLSKASSAYGYTITSGNDSQNRDPKSWTVLGSNDDAAAADASSSSWKQLDSQSGQSFSDRHQVRGFPIAKPQAYKYYQLRITDKSDGTSTNQLQMADWTLVGQQQGMDVSGLQSEDWEYWDTTDSTKSTSDPTHGASDRTSWTTSVSDADASAGWKSGTASFGVKNSNNSDTADLGDGFTANTVIKRYLGADGIVPAYFFKRSFALDSTQLASIGGLIGQITFDDTATVYVNGTRVAGFNDGDVDSNTTPLNFGGGEDPQTALFSIPASVLKAGDNVIAVEVHQCNGTSSDAYFDMPQLYATSDYLSFSYTNSEYTAQYSSSTWPATSDGKDYWVDLLKGYTDLSDSPSVWSGKTVEPGEKLTALNDKKIVQINNTASTAQVDKAINDANNSPVQTMSDAYGTNLGSLYLKAMSSGKLPKTAQVLAMVTSGIDGHDAAKNEYKEARPYQRLIGRIDEKNIGYGFSNDSFPSGHTTAGYVAGTTLATLLSELAPQMLQRTSEYGNNRIVLGFHYPIDVMGGRMGAQAMIGYRWSDPEFQKLFQEAHQEMESVLLGQCRIAGYGDSIASCAGDVATDTQATSTYTDRLTYGFPQVQASGASLIIPTGAEDLLITKYPNLSDAQRKSIIEQTSLDSGYPLDRSNENEASWERINLAAALSAHVTVNADGSVTVEELPSTNVALSSIQVKGVSADVDEASSSDGTTIEVNGAAGITADDVKATTANSKATVKTSVSGGAVTIVVTAADGSSSHTYVVKLKEAVQVGAMSQYVDPFVSTADDDGNDMPGAEAPNGLAKVNPLSTSNRNHTGYNYSSTQISGFTNDNLDGVGGSGGGGDILVVPTSVSYTKRPATASYAHSFSHDKESATPGYYSVDLRSSSGTDSDFKQADGYINAQVTATTRTAMHEYTFPQGQRQSVVFDLKNNFTSRIASSLSVQKLDDGTIAISGKVEGSFNGPNYTLYYYATTDQPVDSVQTWGDGGSLQDIADSSSATEQSGVDTGAVLNFGTSTGKPVDLRITLSPISAAQAKTDQKAEVGSSTFTQVRQNTADSWESLLSRIDVTASSTNDPDGTLKRLFYTHLYSTLAVPVNATSTSGTYRGVDGVVHKANGYTEYDGWSGWDDFRKFSVIAYLYPEIYRDMAQSLINIFADTQAASDTKLPGDLMQSVPTVRFERSAVIIADAISKGYTGFENLSQAYPALQRLVGSYTADELKAGYIADHPTDSLQRGYDDWAMSIIATRLNKADDAKNYAQLAALPLANQYKEDAWTAADGTKVNVLSSKNSSGAFANDDLEQFQAANAYQGTLWQYNWYDAYDMAGLQTAMGGKTAMTDALHHMFGEDGNDDPSSILHSNTNEVDLQTEYLFNYVGQASSTQKWVRQIFTEPSWNRYIATGSTDEYSSSNGEFTPPIKASVYKLSPQGFLPTMDNDAGTMSATFVASAIGLFPVTAGSSQYQIGSPFFDSVKIKQSDGRSFTINAKGASSSNYYIGGATLNGKAYNNTWVDYSELLAGGSLSFDMQSTASDWGSNGAAAYSLSDPTSTGAYESTYRAMVDKTSITTDETGRIKGSFNFTLPNGIAFATSQVVREDPLSSGAMTVVGLPGTVKVTARITGDHSLTVQLDGTVEAATNFHIGLTDAAFSDGALSSSLSGPGLSVQEPLSIDITSKEKLDLQGIVDDLKIEQDVSFTTKSHQAFSDALKQAQKVLADAAATSSDVQSAGEKLQSAASALAIHGSALRTLQAESSDAWSGGDLKNEAYYSDGDLGGVADGAWIQYNDMDFDSLVAAAKTGKTTQITVRYAANYAASDTPSTVEVHAGDKDSPVVATVDLQGTGGYDKYASVETELSADALAKLAAAGTVSFVFHAPSGRTWASNFDYFRFGTQTDDSSATKTLEAESFQDKGGGTNLGVETDTMSNTGKSQTVLKGTSNGDWLRYDDVDFGSSALQRLTVNYVNNSNRCGTNSSIEMYLDAASESDLGTPFATIALPATGSDWYTEGSTTVDLPSSITGTHTVYLKLVTTADSSHPYVANIDSLAFSEKPATLDVTALNQQLDSAQQYVKDKARYTDVDYAAFAKVLAASQATVSNSVATQADVDEATYQMKAAIRQLIPKARLQLEYDIADAADLDSAQYTADTWKVFDDALSNARNVSGISTSSDDALNAADRTLVGAENALILLSDVTIPGIPEGVSAKSKGNEVTVSWKVPEKDGYSAISGYDVRIDGGKTPLQTNASQLSLVIGNLSKGRHTVEVRARNAKGAGDWSASVGFSIVAGSNSGGDDSGSGSHSGTGTGTAGGSSSGSQGGTGAGSNSGSQPGSGSFGSNTGMAGSQAGGLAGKVGEPGSDASRKSASENADLATTGSPLAIIIALAMLLGALGAALRFSGRSRAGRD